MGKIKLSNRGNEDNHKNVPYQLAKLVAGKRIYIKFYVYNETTGKTQRIRREVPATLAKEEQTKWIAQRIAYINELLTAGYYIQKRNQQDALKTKRRSIQEALIEVVTSHQSHTKYTTQHFANGILNSFLSYISQKALSDISVQSIDKSFLMAYLDYLSQKKGVKNITRNNHLKYLRARFEDMRASGWLEKNPCKGIALLATDTKATEVIPAEDLTRILDQAKQLDQEAYVYYVCLFYLFVKPIELDQLKVKQIDITEQQLHLYDTKKKLTHITIPDRLITIFKETALLEKNPEKAIFSRRRATFRKTFKDIVKEIGLPSRYYMYLIRHTGVLMHYQNGCSLQYIQRQCRHHHLGITDTYLRSLGVEMTYTDNTPII
ncbi:MAG: tyrosine-type recombinase/integrase [Thermonemataceae bacterium]